MYSIDYKIFIKILLNYPDYKSPQKQLIKVNIYNINNKNNVYRQLLIKHNMLVENQFHYSGPGLFRQSSNNMKKVKENPIHQYRHSY